MAIKYLKKSPKTSSTDDTKTREIVENILKDIEKTKEEGCKQLGIKFDKYDGEIIVSKEKINSCKYSRLLCSCRKICAYCFCCNECNNRKSSWC